MNNAKLSEEIRRLIAAFRYSVDGFKSISPHPAFRMELIVMSVMLPLGLFLGQNGVERALLVGSLFLVLIVELLNTGIETTIDRISPDLHPLSKRAKDIGSAAVLLSLVNAGAVWFLILI